MTPRASLRQCGARSPLKAGTKNTPAARKGVKASRRHQPAVKYYRECNLANEKDQSLFYNMSL